VIDTLVDRGTTVMLTTQYLEEAERLADDIVVIDHGRIIARGDSRTLKREVGGDQVQVVVVEPGDLRAVARIVAGVTGVEPQVEASGRSVTAPTSLGVRTLVAVAGALDDAGIEVDDLSLRQPTLDEVFLTLTGSVADDGQTEEIEERVA
jgi:ABC-2 type transport system ATP-binding protein